MKKALVLFVLLTGCASRGASDQLAAYYFEVCKRQGFTADNPQAMIGCMNINYNRDHAGGGYSALHGMADVLQSQPQRSGMNCTSRPDHLGGVVTNCY